MVFSSLLFLLLFLPGFLLAYHFSAKRYKNAIALIASLAFYAWGAPNFVVIAVGSIIADFYIVKYLDQSEGSTRKLLLWASVVLNVSLLLYYKYFNFFIENLYSFLNTDKPETWVEIVLPIGISFFTFQKLSYSIDIYRRVEKPLSRLANYMLYILLFPQLIAGPIVRYKEIAGQFKKRKHRSYSSKINGFYRFGIGLAKKVLIANVLGEKADLIFSLELMDLDASIAWLGIICYTFQIYFDFSGYSDMAIGLGMIMGFKFPENFNSPYIAQSITEFWRRWHITLSSWMRDYLYIPLGGNRVKTKLQLYANLWIVFLISGLWHGASWNFVIWGAFHGFFIVCDKLFLAKLTSYIGKYPRILLTFFIVVMSWVLFRAEDLSYALGFYKSLFSFDFSNLYLFINDKLIYILYLAVILSFLSVFGKVSYSYENFVLGKTNKNMLAKGAIIICLLITSIASIASSGFNPFIYFRF